MALLDHILTHLLDLQVAAVIVLGTSLTTGSPSRGLASYSLILAMLVPLVISPPGIVLQHVLRTTDDNRLWSVARYIHDAHNPVLAENPIFPLLVGQSPYVIDSWIFCILSERLPGYDAILVSKMQDHAFSYIVLDEDPESSQGRRWYATERFGPRFSDILLTTYRRAAVVGGEFIYEPKGSGR